MKKHRFLTRTLCLTAALSLAASSVFAISFSDVDNDPTVSWAKSSIQQMSDAGYIKGYEDGTFKPYRAISKMECLLLMSRMLGAEEGEYETIAQNAKELYSSTVSKYNTTYVNELCYLLYTGILTESDLVTYASSASANTELLRHQAAVLMSKLLAANTEAKSYTVTTPTYPDDSQIPTASKPYVEFVTKEGIMNGMAGEQNGTVFSPNTSLTRAQMATLLSRMIPKINKNYTEATITDLDPYKSVITLDSKNGSVTTDTVVYLDGEKASMNDLQIGDVVGALEIGGNKQMIQVLTPADDTATTDAEIVYAVITNMVDASEKKITLADPEDSENSVTYVAAANCVYTVNGSKATFGDLKKRDFVKVTVRNGKITALDVTDEDFTVNGTLVSLEYDDDNHVYVTVLDDNDEEITHVVSNSGAKIARDGANAEYRDLATGDTVKLTVANGKVTRISATSNTETINGVLTEIIISSTPAVTITQNGVAKTYKLRNDVSIKIAGADATIYELRPNVSISGTLDGAEVKSLSIASVITNEKGELSGTVSGVNTSYKVLNITDEDGNLHSVYYNTKTTFLHSNGQTTSAKNIEKGASVSVTGADNNGVFEATIVIVK